MYLLLEFVDEGTTSPVAAEWYRDGLSWWPPHTEKAKLLRCVRAKETPNECAGWTQHRARVLYQSDSLDKVVRKWSTSCDTSDLNSDQESCRKSKPKKQFELLDSSPLRKRPSAYSQSGNTFNRKRKLSFLPPPPTPPPAHQPCLTHHFQADLVSPGPSKTLNSYPETEGESLEYTNMQTFREQTTERILLQMLGELQSQVKHLTEIVTQMHRLGNSPGNAPLTTASAL
nr:uncharacterized protein LOC111837659 [Paramormyrops kingsleyae]